MKTKLILEIVLPIISLIAMIILFTQFYSSSQEKMEGIQKKLDVATSDVIRTCYNLKQKEIQIKNDYGVDSDEFKQFSNRNDLGSGACENSMSEINQSCKEKSEYKDFKSCRDERLRSYYTITQSAQPPRMSKPIICDTNEDLVDGKCIEKLTTMKNEGGPNCGPGTHVEQGICIPDRTRDYCYELSQLQAMMIDQYGMESEEYQQFVQRYGETLQSCYSR